MELADLFSVDGRTVVVTGAASGIGHALATGLGALGARVFALDLRACGAPGATSLTCDVTSEEQVAAAFTRIAEDAGGIDVVFSNAGIAGRFGPLEELALEDWRRVLEVNLDGSFLVCREAVRTMRPAGRGKLVLTGSVWGLVGTRGAPVSAYAASKGGVTNLVRQLALELAPSGITVNGIAPAGIRTAIADGFYDNEAAVAALVADIPLGRVVGPDELLGTAVFLASRASDFVTGHTVAVDGGLLAH